MRGLLVAMLALCACGGEMSGGSGGGAASTGGGSASAGGGSASTGGGSSATGGGSAGTGGGSTATGGGSGTAGGSATGGSGTAGGSAGGPSLAGCPLLPANHIFNTPIDGLPPHPSSAAFMATIGTRNFHLDLGTQTSQQAADYYGIPYNLVTGSTLAWKTVAFTTTQPFYDWDPHDEADCASGTAHTLVSPCLSSTAPTPQLPIPASPLVEGGIFPDSTASEDGDHHILMLDTETCFLWESYHSYTGTNGVWNIFGSARFDLRSNTLRPAGWTSADAAGFPILPLLLRADEASTGTIRHALRFTIPSGSIRGSYVWPGRHKTGNATNMNFPQMGQLFRLKSGFTIPSNFTTQAKAILQAMKTYGFYLADGGSAMYVTGEPSASWSSMTISQVQSVSNSNVEAVDISALFTRPGFSMSSGAVPP